MVVAIIAICMVVFVGLILGAIQYFEHSSHYDREFYNCIRSNDLKSEVKYNPTIKKYYIQLSAPGGWKCCIATRLKRIKYYKDKNVATVEMEKFKGNF